MPNCSVFIDLYVKHSEKNLVKRRYKKKRIVFDHVTLMKFKVKFISVKIFSYVCRGLLLKMILIGLLLKGIFYLRETKEGGLTNKHPLFTGGLIKRDSY